MSNMSYRCRPNPNAHKELGRRCDGENMVRCRELVADDEAGQETIPARVNDDDEVVVFST